MGRNVVVLGGFDHVSYGVTASEGYPDICILEYVCLLSVINITSDIKLVSNSSTILAYLKCGVTLIVVVFKVFDNKVLNTCIKLKDLSKKLALRILRLNKRYMFAFNAIQCNVQQRVVHGSHDGPVHGRYVYSCSRIEGYETIEGEVFHPVHSYIM